MAKLLLSLISLFLSAEAFLPSIKTPLVSAATRGRGDLRMMATPALDQHVIVGRGRVATALKEMMPDAIIVTRDDEVPSEGHGPIYICTRNDDLKEVVEKTPGKRRKDLVFMQNGMLGPFLENYGLEDNTQCLVYFAVAKKGEKPIDGVTDLNPEGLTAANGKWAEELASTLQKNSLSCRILDQEAFSAAMFEKLIWISAFMVVGAAHGGITVGEVESKHKDEVVALIKELKGACHSLLGTSFIEGTEERLCAYTRSVAHFPTAVKEFEWRNGFFWGLTQKETANGKPDPCPLHTALLKKVKAVE